MDRPILDKRWDEKNKVTQYLTTCLWCGQEKWINKYLFINDLRLFCSYACSLAYERSNDPELNRYEWRLNKENRIEVHLICEYCEKDFWRRYSGVKKGDGRFCSHKCASKNLRESENAYKIPGFENGKFYWNSSTNRYEYNWRTEEGKISGTTGSRALWILHNGYVPNGMKVINKNPSTLEIENLYLSASNRPKEDYERGENSRWWRGGVEKPYSKEYYEIRDFVLLRDDYQCQICSCNENIHVHHIDRNKKNNTAENMIVVCAGCHLRIHQEKDTTDPTILAFQALLQ